MADKKSNLTNYDRKFIAALIAVNFSLTMLAISLFGLYYYEKEIKFKEYMKLNEKRYAILKSLLKDYDSEMKLRGLEWDYATKEGIGAELVPKEKTNTGK